MPSTYAHYRFGTAALGIMPADARRTIQRFRRLYDVGLHGPDIFYYRAPLLKSAENFLGIKYHEQTGQAFFQRVCRSVRLERSEAALSYLYGVLSHYALDSVCHPFISEQAGAEDLSHARIETEFDRFLMVLDGKKDPHSQDLTLHLQLTPGEWETVAKFYPPANAPLIRDSLRGMTRLLRFFATPDGPRRRVMEKSVGLFAREYNGMIMTVAPDAQCAALNEPLLALYGKALEQFPEMLSGLQAHLTYSAPFGEEFEKIFG